MVRVIEYHLFPCRNFSNVQQETMLKFGLRTKVPKLFANSSLFCVVQSQSKRLHYSRCQMLDISMIPTNIGFCFESSQNTILASCQALFSYNTMLNSNFFFMSPPSPSSFLGVDFGVCNSSKLVAKFPDCKVLSETSVGFDSSLFRS